VKSVIHLLRRDQRGAAAVEFALAVPVLILMIWGIFQIGLLLEANAGMQQALGEGARYATLCLDPDPDMGCSVPADADIKAKMDASIFKPSVGTFTAADPVDGAGFKTLSVTYTMPLDFLFFTGPTVTINKSKKVYVVT
jgi:Flp pilus assembly protein TadG